VIESAYNPMAYSHANAVGLWQFIPSTGRYFNLRQTRAYDGRRDITASTLAALNYLTRLHDMFNGDWLLALAAYNAGEGTVSRAIERNEKLGLPTDYWNLPLPQETKDYVPKLLALSQVVLAPEAYGINLNPIANEPYFEMVEDQAVHGPVPVAALAEIDEDEMFQLNPAYKQRATTGWPAAFAGAHLQGAVTDQPACPLNPEELVSLRPKKPVFDEVEHKAVARARAAIRSRAATT
jgi:membrane-bound lytic murein transglycosylase D